MQATAPDVTRGECQECDAARGPYAFFTTVLRENKDLRAEDLLSAPHATKHCTFRTGFAIRRVDLQDVLGQAEVLRRREARLARESKRNSPRAVAARERAAVSRRRKRLHDRVAEANGSVDAIDGDVCDRFVRSNEGDADDIVATFVHGPRRAELVDALAMCNLKLRRDSRLCENFILRGPSEGWTSKGVVRRMCEMEFLHVHTRYKWMCNAAIREAREYGEYGGHRAICESVEKRVLASLPGGTWPERWPWALREWKVVNHTSRSPHFRSRVRALLTALWIATPLAAVDLDTRKQLAENIIKCYADAYYRSEAQHARVD